MPDGALKPQVRLSDVARLAQCSAATVSRVLNAPETVNRDARKRVEAAVRELGYTPNGAARALRSRRSRMVGAILPTLRQPIYAEFIGALQDRLAQRDYCLIVTSSGFAPEAELQQARLLAARGIDGLVLVGHTHPDALFRLLDAQELPFVSVYTFRPEAPWPMVGFDDAAAMEGVVDHLHALGHREIAVLSGPLRDSDRTRGRVEGAAAALARRGVPLPPRRRAERPISISGGRAGLRALLGAAPAPTAVVCTSDQLAFGVLFECMAEGIPVPDALSVTGFDDLQAAAQVVPPLTTVAIPSEEMGQRAADTLFARFAGRTGSSPVLLDTRLIVRGSTAPCVRPG